jgi:hypothetical protein
MQLFPDQLLRKRDQLLPIEWSTNRDKIEVIHKQEELLETIHPMAQDQITKIMNR